MRIVKLTNAVGDGNVYINLDLVFSMKRDGDKTEIDSSGDALEMVTETPEDIIRKERGS